VPLNRDANTSTQRGGQSRAAATPDLQVYRISPLLSLLIDGKKTPKKQKPKTMKKKVFQT